MKNNQLNILIIDDHPLIAEAYENILIQVLEKEYTLKIEVLNTIDLVLDKLESKNLLDTIDLVFLDIKLAPSKRDSSLISGEDLGILLKKRKPDLKIIVSTTYNDNYRIHSILKSVDPDGFLVKNDLTPEELRSAITTVIDNPPYYSQTVLQLMRKQMGNDYLLDELDRRLLFEISSGTKMKDLPNFLPLSIAGIEKRKRNLKMLFDVEKEGDSALIKVAKAKGFI